MDFRACRCFWIASIVRTCSAMHMFEHVVNLCSRSEKEHLREDHPAVKDYEIISSVSSLVQRLIDCLTTELVAGETLRWYTRKVKPHQSVPVVGNPTLYEVVIVLQRSCMLFQSKKDKVGQLLMNVSRRPFGSTACYFWPHRTDISDSCGCLALSSNCEFRQKSTPKSHATKRDLCGSNLSATVVPWIGSSANTGSCFKLLTLTTEILKWFGVFLSLRVPSFCLVSIPSTNRTSTKASSPTLQRQVFQFLKRSYLLFTSYRHGITITTAQC